MFDDDQNANSHMEALKHHRKLAFRVFVAVLVVCGLAGFLTLRYSASAVVALNLAEVTNSGTESSSPVEVAWSRLPDTEIQALIEQFHLDSGLTGVFAQGQTFTYVRSRISLHQVESEGEGPPEIVVSYISPDRSTVVDLTNALAQSLAQAKSGERQHQPPGGGTRTIAAELEKSRRTLQLLSKGQNTQALKAQLQKHFIIDQQLHASLQEVELKLSALEQERQQNEQAASAARARATAAPVPNPEWVAIEQQLIQAQNRLNELRQRYTEQYPDVIEARTTVDELQAKLNRIPLNKPPAQTARPPAASLYEEAQIADQMAPLQDSESDLEQKIHDNQEDAEAIRQRISDGTSFAQDYALEQAHYNSLLKAKESGIAGAGAEGPQLFAIVQSATSADPQGLGVNPVFWALSVVGSLLAALLAVYLAEQFDPTVVEQAPSESLHPS